MALETATYINGLNASNPTATDLKSEGDDHIRLLKSTIKATFPSVSGAVTATHTELNYVDGVTSAIQTQLNARAPIANPTFTGNIGVGIANEWSQKIEAYVGAYTSSVTPKGIELVAGAAGGAGWRSGLYLGSNSNGEPLTQLVVPDAVTAGGRTTTPALEIIGSSGGAVMNFYVGGAEKASLTSGGNFIVGTAALATNATAGFPWIPSCAGAPSGSPTAPYSNAAALIVDTTNDRLYARVGSNWKYTELRSAKTYVITAWSLPDAVTSNVSNTVNMIGDYINVGGFVTGVSYGVTVDPVAANTETTVYFESGAQNFFSSEDELSGSGTWRSGSTIVPVEIKAVVASTYGVAVFYPTTTASGKLRLTFAHGLGDPTP